MKKMYFTITGTKHYHGQTFMKKGMTVRLVKEPDNVYDKEAIKVMMKGLDKIGYVANSPYTTMGDSFSAGRLYDKIGKNAEGKILYVAADGILCYVTKKQKE